MKAGVPMATPAPVSVAPELAESALAMPKSVTITRPRGPSSRMLSGLMSRWMMENAWAALSASADLRHDAAGLVHRQLAPAADPARHRLAVHVAHDEVDQAVALADGVDRDDVGMAQPAAVCASRVNRSRMSCWKASSGGSTLIATRRWSRSSRAR